METPMRKKQKQTSKPKKESVWRKVPRTTGLYEYRPSGTFFTHIMHGGRLYRESLKTSDLAFAKRKLHDFKQRLQRTDPRFGKMSFIAWLKDVYLRTLKGSESTLADKRRIIERVKRTWVKARTQPMRDLKPTDVERWLNEEFGGWSTSYYNSALSLVRDALAKAVADHMIMENPAGALKWRKRTKPIRLTPTFEQFQEIVADIRSQRFNGHDAEQSGDFIEFLGLAGLGQAEASALTRADVDLDAGRIIVYRFKTDQGFAIPIYPQARALIEKLCKGRRPNERLFEIDQARAALSNACKRLGYALYTQRSLRRMFITRCIEEALT
jgi:integrase